MGQENLHIMRYFVLLAILWELAASPLICAQQPSANAGPANAIVASSPMSTKLTPGSTVFIEKMGGFENYLAAAFAKKKVQLVVVGDKEKADYVISGTSEDKKAGWAKIVFLGDLHRDADASITMMNNKTSAIAFAYAVNKKSTLHGSQTTAEACAKHLEAHIEGRE